MSYSRYDPVWKIMENYNMEYLDVIDSEFKCTLCNSLMKNAHSNFCGCRYCFECITNFINAGNTCCPGPTSDCKENEINLLINIQIDHVINKKIVNMNVKCPFGICNFEGDLLTFVEHEEFHMNQMKNFDHIDKENIYECVDLCDKPPINRKHLDQAKSNRVSSSIDASNVPTISELKSMLEKNDCCIRNLRNRVDTILIELNQLNSENKRIRDFIKLPNIKEIDAKNLNSKKDEKVKRSKSKKSIKDDKETKVNDIPKSFCVALRWAINNFSLKRDSARNSKNTCIYSKTFYAYKNGYRFCLCAWPNGVGDTVDKFLSVGVCLVKGKYDKKLSWPMKHKISMCFVNQSTNKIHLQSDYCYDKANEMEKERYMQPSQRNDPIGTLRFVNFNNLYSDQFILKDTIILEFLLNYES